MIRVFNQYVSGKSLLLMVVEALLIVLSLICAVKLRFWNNPAEALFYLSLPDFAVQAAIVVLVCLACFYYNDLYDLSTGYSAVERVLRVEQSLGAASLLLGLLYFMFPGLLLGAGRVHHRNGPGHGPGHSEQKAAGQGLAAHGSDAAGGDSGDGPTGAGAGAGIDAPRRPQHETGGLCRRRRTAGRKREDLRVSGPGSRQRDGGHREGAGGLENHRRHGGPPRRTADQGVGDVEGSGSARGGCRECAFGVDRPCFAPRGETELVRVFRWIPQVQMESTC